MVLTKEYRICMPLTVEEYRIGQLYMIARHSHEQSDSDEGVEVVENTECEDPVHGKGQFTEKRIHLSNKLPYWIQALIPRIFYVTEKAWNYYPFTITEYTCSFIPKFQISIKTRYEDNNGSSENCLGLTPVELIHREVDFIDIAYDELSAKHYKEEEDPKFFQSKKTGRGPLIEGWRESTQPIMCSYKLVDASFEVWGMQTRVEDFIHKCIRDILLLGHRQAFAWIDEWHDMSLDDVRQYESKMHAATNEKIQPKTEPQNSSQPGTPSGSIPSSPKSPTGSANRSWFSWS
ncbi:GSCOCG00000672001-RA-CDS [Cotesia congregata]|uniref:Cytoplasmic phosphatidylinositol transfer protein 1 n=1 Tax=Cotesia congregata TaxID=51543 RepID=A0A8J2HAY1_COTCN|nr:GSCOCG00000672001-RA-CDS [Cotesia congregata]CAG5087224.1 Similar to rdgBbeta: Cytoplasmic phosphatidylinositol transfer protein 1 (Drosophila melanogaster) [Cotesia congregata]